VKTVNSRKSLIIDYLTGKCNYKIKLKINGHLLIASTFYQILNFILIILSCREIAEFFKIKKNRRFLDIFFFNLQMLNVIICICGLEVLTCSKLRTGTTGENIFH